MTREHSQSQASKGSSCNNSRRQQQKSSLDSVTSIAVGESGGLKRPTSSSGGGGGGRSVPPCGTLVQRRHDTHCSHHCDEAQQLDSKERTLSGLEESSGITQLRSDPRSVTPSSTVNEISLDDPGLNSQETDETAETKAARLSSMALKKQVIYYQGKLRTVFVQVWPDAHRIPVHERHRLQEPMKRHYGKMSNQARLLKEFESLKKRPMGLTIPLLPKHMRDETKVRLMAWYRPLNLTSTHRVCVPDDSAIRLPTSSEHH